MPSIMLIQHGEKMTKLCAVGPWAPPGEPHANYCRADAIWQRLAACNCRSRWRTASSAFW